MGTHSAIRQVRKDLKGMVVFLFWLEAAMIPILLPWCWLNGELSTLNEWSEYGEFGAWAFILIVAVIGGFRAYVQNLVLRYNNALTLAAANILIQALTIIISIWLFNTSTTIELDMGIVVSMLGYAMYTMQKTLGKAGDDKKKRTSRAERANKKRPHSSMGPHKFPNDRDCNLSGRLLAPLRAFLGARHHFPRSCPSSLYQLFSQYHSCQSSKSYCSVAYSCALCLHGLGFIHR